MLDMLIFQRGEGILQYLAWDFIGAFEDVVLPDPKGARGLVAPTPALTSPTNQWQKAATSTSTTRTMEYL